MATVSYTTNVAELTEIMATIGWRYRQCSFDLSTEVLDSGVVNVVVQTRRADESQVDDSDPPMREAMALQAGALFDLQAKLDAAESQLAAVRADLDRERALAEQHLAEVRALHEQQMTRMAEVYEEALRRQAAAALNEEGS